MAVQTLWKEWTPKVLIESRTQLILCPLRGLRVLRISARSEAVSVHYYTVSSRRCTLLSVSHILPLPTSFLSPPEPPEVEVDVGGVLGIVTDTSAAEMVRMMSS